jgi:hypothetical protein
MRARSVSAACALLLSCLCAADCHAQDAAPKLAEYMDALAAQGRQAEALAVFERVREALADAAGRVGASETWAAERRAAQPTVEALLEREWDLPPR